MTDGHHRRPLPVGPAAGVVAAAGVAVFAISGFGEALLLALAIGVLTIGYLARRYLRDALLYIGPATTARPMTSRRGSVEDE